MFRHYYDIFRDCKHKDLKLTNIRYITFVTLVHIAFPSYIHSSH